MLATVVPTFGQAPFLAETLASLERQTLGPAEIIVVDDGSEPAVELPPTTLPVRLLRIEHAGIAGARNAGVRATTAPIVHVCDHDDLVEPAFYERVLAAGGDVAHADCGFVDERGVPFPGRLGSFEWRRPVRQLVRRNPIASTAAVFARDLFDAVGGFRDLAFVQDWDFWIRCAAAGGQYRYVPEVLAWHRVHPAQQSAEARRRAMLAESLAMLRTASVPLEARWSRARGVAELRLQLYRVARRPA
jgi:glycosyltransferase involved in cell wall biosynthesis